MKRNSWRMKIILFTLSLLPFVSSLASSNNILKGEVRDKEGELLVGVSVFVKEENSGTITDENGQFSLSVKKPKVTITFSYIGYKTKEKIATNKDFLLVHLEEDLTQLDELVVTALGIKREKKSLGYSSQSINEEDINTGNETNLTNRLSGKFAGVQVTAGNSGAGSSSRIVIRGESSFSNDNQPLYVVDGIPINNYIYSNLSGTPQEVDYGNGAGELNSNDIENISILKGANASALYGSRASNGVILITTKSGNKKDHFNVELNSTTTFEQISRLPKYQNSYSQGLGNNFEYWDGKNGKGTQDHQDMSWGRPIDGSLVPQFDSPSISGGETYRGGDVLMRKEAAIEATPLIAQPNNVRDFFKTGVTQSTNIAISGNHQYGSTRISFTNLYSEGVIPNVDLRRNNISLNNTSNLTKKFSIKTSATYINSISDNRPSMGYGPENPMYTFNWFGRQVNANSLREYWQRGYEGLNQYHFNSGWNDNPFFTMYENTNAYKKHRMYGNIAINYEITPGLVLILRRGLDFFYDQRESKRAYSTQRFLKGAYKRENVFFLEQNSDLLIQWDKNFDSAWRIALTGGANSMSQENGYDYAFANGLSVPGVYNIGNSASNISVIQELSRKKTNSLLFSGQIAYNEKLFLNITARNDWSSTLTRSDGSGDNSYFYPSASLSAVMTEIFALPKSITYWSLRGGYAEVGSDTQPYRLETNYSYTPPYGSSAGVSLPSTLTNKTLTPERMHSFEIGTDFRMFNNRAGIDITYYNTLNTQQIIEVPISTASGYRSQYINAGQIRNNGIEATLSLTPIKTANKIQWDINFNFAANRSLVEKINDQDKQYVYSWAAIYSDQDARVYAIAKAGEAMGNLYGTGFKQTESGEVIVDKSGLPIADPRLVKLGNYNPDFTLSAFNKISFKNFTLDFLLDWHQGGVFVSRTFGMGMESGVLEQTQNRNPKDMVIEGVVWNDATNTYVKNTKEISPRDYYRNLYRRYHETQSTFSASFVKLREMRLAYAVPNSFLKKTIIKKAYLSLVGRNLFMWTKDQNIVDPESVSYEGEKITPGVEEMSYPSTRSFGFNINITL